MAELAELERDDSKRRRYQVQPNWRGGGRGWLAKQTAPQSVLI